MHRFGVLTHLSWLTSLLTITRIASSALLPATPNTSFATSDGSTLPLNESSIPFLSNNLTVAPGVVDCNSGRYGTDLSRSSCIDALQSLPSGTTLRTFGERGRGAFREPLPRRYLSADGKCAIDISNTRNRAYDDSATDKQMKDAAQRVVERCGVHGNLVATVKAYKPRVMCTPQKVTDDAGACQNLLAGLRVEYNWATFGKQGVREATWNIPPAGLKDRDGTGYCVSTVNFVEGGDIEKARWFDIWAAAVAVKRMCVRKGNAGIAFGLDLESCETMSTKQLRTVPRISAKRGV
ncbi:hypothetical protein G7Y79_00004g014790 [Physcia stellaris]|nr:hypothetical protein G7Y79_00004g014790 [Physcia stellaris]